MAINKNQHYVPRCYLKPFTHNENGKAINVFNIDRNKCIPTAPVKNQCSRNYFYGKDVKLENAIQFVEKSYALTLSELQKSPNTFNEIHEAVLRRFWLLQYLRTEASSRRSVELSNSIGEVAGISKEEYKSSIKEAVLAAMKVYAERMEIIDDLKICLVINKTEYPFITSDDPAVLSNRWHLSDDRTKFGSFGLEHSGDLLFLPLSPNLLCLLYDGDVYSVSHKKKLISISNKRDVISFNQHQILNCKSNIYIKEMRDENFIGKAIDECKANRITERHQTTYAVSDSAVEGYSRYRIVDQQITKEHNKDAIIHTKTVHYSPLLWPSIIKWRKKGAVYTNGTGQGYLRKHHAFANPRGFYKECIR